MLDQLYGKPSHGWKRTQVRRPSRMLWPELGPSSRWCLLCIQVVAVILLLLSASSRRSPSSKAAAASQRVLVRALLLSRAISFVPLPLLALVRWPSSALTTLFATLGRALERVRNPVRRLNELVARKATPWQVAVLTLTVMYAVKRADILLGLEVRLFILSSASTDIC